MLKFLKLTMNNFGCYKGTKEIDFGAQDGVTLLWGNNGFGKSTMLNALRYVMFGDIKGRHNVDISPKDMINWADNSSRSFSVSLEFSSDDTVYILTRKYGIIDLSRDPDNPRSYKSDPPSLWCNGSIFSQDKTQHILNSIMPKEVSRFFLFDGELLEEYERLLQEEDAIGRKIKTAIEEILGVPVLTNALADLDALAAQYDQVMTTASLADQASRDLGNAIARATNELETQKASLQEHKDNATRLNTELESLDAQRRRNDALSTLINEIDTQNGVVRDREGKISSYRAQIAENYSASAWKYSLHGVINELIEDNKRRTAEIDGKRNQHTVATHMLDELIKSKNNRVCSVCDKPITESEVTAIQAKIDQLQSQYPELKPEEQQEYRQLNGNLSRLTSALTNSEASAIEIIEESIMDCLTDIADAKQKISDWSQSIDDYAKDKAEIDNLLREYTTTQALLNNEQHCIQQMEDEISQKENDLAAMRRKLAGMSGNNAVLIKAQQDSAFSHKLRDLFNSGLDTYREYLKKQVERDATEIFIHLSNDPNYSKLVINDNYGLSIEHGTGRIVSVRSAGFEQIVALSLIGALHKNAPMQGPIVMDSPFGRIDSVHEANIFKYLPDMASQVMLFVYDTEINEEKAISSLGNRLVQQFELIRGGTFETNIGRKV